MTSINNVLGSNTDLYIKGYKPELKTNIIGQLKNKQENKAQKKKIKALKQRMDSK